MSGIRDTATVTLNVNGAQAKQFMADLEKQIQDTEAAIEDMQNRMADPKDIEKAKKQLKTYKKQLDEMRSATEGVNRALENIELATPRELEKALRTLNRQMKDMVPGSEVWDSHIEKIRELKARLADFREEMGEQQTLWDKLKHWADEIWPTVDLGVRGYNALVSGLRSYVDAYADMDQEMANVRKFTGMTEAQVESLNEEFKKIDTRSSREELNKLAQEAGRLGKTSEEDVLGFVRAADKINVALDDLGEGATLTLSKLTGIFGDEARYGTEQSLLKVGSVINELSQNCSASAPYLANFASRMGGVGAQAKMTIPQIMGFGAVLDENGQKVEASATALSQVIVRLYQDPAKYAKIAGLDAKEFADLMREDANAALILFLETLQKAGGMDVLSPMFKDMGENGSRAIAALSTLATHIDKVKEQQEAANGAFRDGTSIDQEFAVQNNTVQAGLDKAKKRVRELSVELGQKLYPLMGKLVVSGSAVLKGMNMALDFISVHKTSIALATAAWLSYSVAVNAAVIKQKLLKMYLQASTIAMNAFRVATILGHVAVNVLSLQFGKAAHNMKLLNLAIKQNPIGLLVSLITAAIAALWGWTESLNANRKAQQGLNKAIDDSNRQYASEKKNIDELFDRLRRVKEGTEAYEKAKAAIIDQYGQYIQGLIDEKNNLIDVEAAYKAVAKAAREAAAERNMKTLKDKAYDEWGEKNEANTNRLLAIIQKYAKDKDDVNKIYQYVLQDVERNGVLTNEAEKYLRSVLSPGKSKSGPIGLINSVLVEMSKVDEQLNATIHNIEERFGAGFNKYTNYSVEQLEIMHAELADMLKMKDVKEYEIYADGKLVEGINDRADATLALYKMEEALAQKKADKGKESAETTIGGYVSEKASEKEAKKAEREAKRELAKAKEEYKAAIAKAKGDYEAAMAEAIAKYSVGDTSYEEYMAEREKLDLKYVKDRKAVYDSLYEGESAAEKRLLLLHDEEYQALLLKEAELRKKSADEWSKKRVSVQEREYKRDLEELKASFSDRNSALYGDEMAQQEALHQLKVKYLKNYRDSYKENTKEYAEYTRQIEEAETEWRLQKQKKYTELVARFQKDYSQISAEQRMAIELRILDELYAKKRISEEQYQKWRARTIEVYSAAADKGATSASSMSKSIGGNSIAAQRVKGLNELNKRLLEGKISLQKYEAELEELDRKLQRSIFEKFAQGLDPLAQSVVNLGSVFADVFSSIEATGKLTFDNIAEIGAAAFATISASLEMYSQFAAAQSRIDIANVEKRYDAEIQRAQGNTYKTQRLEKKKEHEINKIKAEATEKEFNIKVFQAVAQTAQNALLGYAAGLMMPFPLNTWMPATLAGMAAAMGAVQVALIKKQQEAAKAEGYAEGGFTRPGGKYEPAGIVHAGEWVASQKLLANPLALSMIEALDYAQRTNTIGSLRAEDVSRSITAPVEIASLTGGNDSALLIASAIARSAEAVSSLTDRLNQPIVAHTTVAGDYGIKQAQEEYARLIRNVTPKNKRK